LYGDFDGSSAHELIDTLISHGNDCVDIFIDTNDLGAVYPLGVKVFQKRLNSLAKKYARVIFLGKYKHNFAIVPMPLV
jgi:hypothetical protein